MLFHCLGSFLKIPIFDLVKLAILFFLVLLSSPANTSEQESENLEITCFSTAYPPYVIEKESEISGIDVDLIREAAARTGIQVTVKTRPWKRLERDLMEKRVDCVFAYFRTPERLNYANYSSVPLHLTEYTMFIRTTDADSLQSLQEMQHLSVGVNRGFKTTPEFEAMKKAGKIDVVEVTEDKQSMEMLKLGRVDGVLTNKDVGHFVAKTLGLQGITTLPKPLSSTPAYLVVRPDPKLNRWLEAFDSALYGMLIDGTYNRIRNKYRIN